MVQANSAIHKKTNDVIVEGINESGEKGMCYDWNLDSSIEDCELWECVFCGRNLVGAVAFETTFFVSARGKRRFVDNLSKLGCSIQSVGQLHHMMMMEASFIVINQLQTGPIIDRTTCWRVAHVDWMAGESRVIP